MLLTTTFCFLERWIPFEQELDEIFRFFPWAMARTIEGLNSHFAGCKLRPLSVTFDAVPAKSVLSNSRPYRPAEAPG